MKKSHYYKGFVMCKKFNQWVIDSIGGFSTMREAREYIDTVKRKEKRRANRLSYKFFYNV